jgi:hypothetical protein
MGALRQRPRYLWPGDMKAEWAPDRRRTHVTCMIVESSFRGTDPHRLGPVAVAWTAAMVGTVELVVSPNKVEVAVASAAAAAAAAVAVAAVGGVVVAAAAAASGAVPVGVGVGVDVGGVG